MFLVFYFSRKKGKVILGFRDDISCVIKICEILTPNPSPKERGDKALK